MQCIYKVVYGFTMLQYNPEALWYFDFLYIGAHVACVFVAASPVVCAGCL